jgi:hypothetical protein
LSRQLPAFLFAIALGDSPLPPFVGARFPTAAAQLAVRRSGLSGQGSGLHLAFKALNLQLMSVQEIKEKLAALPRNEQDEVIAYLFHLRHAHDPAKPHAG